MSTDGDNIVRGRMRRWVAVNGRTFNPCGPKKGKEPATLKKDADAKVLGSAPNVDVVIQKNGGV